MAERTRRWIRHAEFSPGDPEAKRGTASFPTFRYLLGGHWQGAGPPLLSSPWREGTLLWICLNPSTASHLRDDATIRRIQGFTLRERFRRYAVINLFAYRSRQPADLLAALDPVGPRNRDITLEQIGESAAVVCAWGAGGWCEHDPRMLETARDRASWIRRLLTRRGAPPAWALGFTDRGSPRHPLYIAKGQRMVPMLWG